MTGLPLILELLTLPVLIVALWLWDRRERRLEAGTPFADEIERWLWSREEARS